ncbi:DoxX family protein [Asticcacaulis excentricus]|uniref:DoxX family protein n=1 Tax=Asticcacaulis excentricus (strain ATCC 15261 / DSM 4724 / KCTC 12464 / NCIMB 9791 / VKM B-1370 / CB 48) TaxID=573065 RepID=E8RQX3_ASTEC|nr:DoxX family protein [Asticcacaulis excentricus]ADU12236.1 DoxX family protein [Asticcacaulis excentricus CB 48]
MTFDTKAALCLAQKPVLLWLPRLMLAAMFIESGVDKLWHWTTYLQDAAAHGIPLAPLSLALAVSVEILGSAALLAGVCLTPALLALAVYTLSVNFFYFDFWAMVEPASLMARKEFLKNIAVAGGLLSGFALTLRTHKREAKA